ncbi:MAG: amino acid adenylation domain-containing protein [Chloroflexi bacterium]|nr:amino acid adenylation domain-containing protein [Chloroflexota bacterium]
MIASLPQLLDQTTGRYPDHEAIRFKGESLSYAELQQQANRLAGLLIEQGVQRGDRVGLYMKKSLSAVVALYGIMKAGAAYVPIDPFMPVARLKQIVADGDIRCLITENSQEKQVYEAAEESDFSVVLGLEPQPGSPFHCLPWPAVAQVEAGRPAVQVTAGDLAYILYTSGSTGIPKGVAHSHASALHFALWAAAEYGLQADDRLSNHAPFHFDLSTFDLYSAAAVGATCVLVPEFLTKFPTTLAKWIAEEGISVWYSVPYALIQLMEKGQLGTQELPALRWILFAGEAFPVKHLRQLMALLPAARFSNLYGPTETNVCTYYHVVPIAANETQGIPIGRPCPNMEMLVVDEEDRPVKAGEVGELLVSGPTVTRGYWNRPALNARAFLRWPRPGGRRTSFTAPAIWCGCCRVAITNILAGRIARSRRAATGLNWMRSKRRCSPRRGWRRRPFTRWPMKMAARSLPGPW